MSNKRIAVLLNEANKHNIYDPNLKDVISDFFTHREVFCNNKNTDNNNYNDNNNNNDNMSI